MALFFLAATAHAQETIVFEDTLSQGWHLSWNAGANGSQASFSNWAKGGVNTVSVTGRSTFTAKQKKDQFGYGFLLNTRFGKAKIEDEGTRKTDDRIAIRNRFIYDLSTDNSDLKLFGNINLNTQFDRGFDYGAGPDGEDILQSKFFAPAYLSQNAGLAYSPTDFFGVEIGGGFKQTIVTDTSLGPLYGLSPGDNTLFEGGINIGIYFEYGLAENLIYSTNVESFTNVERKVTRTDVYFSNIVVGKINSFMDASLQFDLVYDDDFSKEVQLAQVLSIGIAFSLL
jgi:hypothetical protein